MWKMRVFSARGHFQNRLFGNIWHMMNSLRIRKFSTVLAATGKVTKYYGQPAPHTHPQLFRRDEVTPGITKHEYRARRQSIMKKIKDSRIAKSHPEMDHIMIFTSAPKKYMSIDVPYIYRQNTEFLYMSGFQEPDSVLVMHTNKLNAEDCEVIFVPERSQSEELWEGPCAGVSGARDLLGIQNVDSVSELEGYLSGYLKNQRNSCLWYEYMKPVNRRIHGDTIVPFMKELTHVEKPTKLVHQQRLVKSPAEIELMRESTWKASEAFVETMRFSRPGINESHLFAKMDFECRIRDAEYLAYPPVVAGGNRANTIHYIANNQVIEDGDLVLMDAGCEYHGYCSDITRTWPVSGKFTQAQRALYDATLLVQEVCIGMCRPGVNIEEIYRAMLALLAEQIKKLNLVPSSAEATELISAACRFCPHHVGHFLGMDVHDSSEVTRSIPLMPGMIITIEPGIYIPETSGDVDPQYRGIGIRIEDNILITANGHENLTKSCPKDPDEIERILTK